MLKKCNCCEAKLSDNRLVLSLPDALTPVMWVMDMADIGTFVMRVEQDDNGLFVLQKLSTDGGKVEDIACYDDKNKAISAMSLISKTIHGQKSGRLDIEESLVLNVLRLLILYGIGICLLFLSVLFSYEPAKIILKKIFMENKPDQVVVTEPTNQTNNVLPTVSSDPKAVGVPMSVDDFFNNRNGAGIP